jgi:Geranylgeranyl pyrophosphate synthase
MQSMAFSLLAREQSADPDTRMKMVAELARAAGPHGICAGQDLDLAGLSHARNHQDVLAIAKHKTAAMFRASCVLGGLAAGLDSPKLEKYEAFGESLGILFQLRDDMLDETGDEQMMGKKAGKDRDAGKATIWSVDDNSSIQEVLSLAHRETLALLAHIDDRPSLLQTICDFVMARSH